MHTISKQFHNLLSIITPDRISVILALLALLVSSLSYIEARRSSDFAAFASLVNEQVVWKVEAHSLGFQFKDTNPEIITQTVTLHFPTKFHLERLGLTANQGFASTSFLKAALSDQMRILAESLETEAGMHKVPVPVIVHSFYVANAKPIIDESIYLLYFDIQISGGKIADIQPSFGIFSARVSEDYSESMLNYIWDEQLQTLANSIRNPV